MFFPGKDDKNTFKSRILLQNCRSFQYCKICPVCLEMFPILGTNLWFHYYLVYNVTYNLHIHLQIHKPIHCHHTLDPQEVEINQLAIRNIISYLQMNRVSLQGKMPILAIHCQHWNSSIEQEQAIRQKSENLRIDLKTLLSKKHHFNEIILYSRTYHSENPTKLTSCSGLCIRTNWQCCWCF